MAQQTRSKSIALFELELDGNDESGCTASDVLQELLEGQSAHCSSDEQRKVTSDAQKAHMLALSPSGEVSLERFAQLLAMHGHHVWLRTGRLDCCCGQVALRHTFVLAGSSGAASDEMPQLFVVDPCFKEQFSLPNATPEYQSLWNDLPNLFVGTAEQLVPVVELMCTQMQRVFADTATSCPPWRTPTCMLTKWLPSAADDIPVAAPGSSDSDISTRPSSSNTNSALSSPATLRGTASKHFLAPICTIAPPQPTGMADDALTPRSARSPLYFDQERVSCRAFLAPRTPDDLNSPFAQLDCSASDVQPSLVVHWGPQDDTGLDAAASERIVSESCFMESGSWGLGALEVAGSSPRDVSWDLLRHCHSEDVMARIPAGNRARAVAIGRRPAFKTDQGRGGNGFADALVNRGLARVMELSVDAALPPASAPNSRGSNGPGAAGSALFGAHPYRSRVLVGNASLDISRFDRNTAEDDSPAPLVWGNSPSRKLSSIGSKSPAAAGAVCSPVKRRGSNSSSQCSALSAAIAGKGVGMR